MKKLSKVLCLMALAFGISYAVNAQTVKIAYVDSSVITEMMPERTKVEQDLQTYYTELQNELQTMANEYQTKLKDYEANAATMSNILRQSKEKEIMDLQGRIQDFQANAETAFDQKRIELLTPLIEKVQNAVNAVGKEKGYTYIFDKSVGAIVYIGEGAIDITADVKAKLGL